MPVPRHRRVMTFVASVVVSRLPSLEQSSMRSILRTSLGARPKGIGARRAFALLSAAAAFCGVPALASAQTASGVMKHDTATAGRSDVATETFDTSKKVDDAAKDATEA